MTKLEIKLVDFNKSKVTKSAQDIAINLNKLIHANVETFENNFLSCYLPLWQLLQFRKAEQAKYTPEFVKSLNNGKTSVQLKAELDASLLLCTIDKNSKRNGIGAFSESDIKKTSALFGKSSLSPQQIADKIIELNQGKNKNGEFMASKSALGTEAGSWYEKADNKNSFEIPTNLTIQDVDKIVQEFTKQLLKANNLTEKNYIAYKESSLPFSKSVNKYILSKTK